MTDVILAEEIEIDVSRATVGDWASLIKALHERPVAVHFVYILIFLDACSDQDVSLVPFADFDKLLVLFRDDIKRAAERMLEESHRKEAKEIIARVQEFLNPEE